jgi:F-box interacting protein
MDDMAAARAETELFLVATTTEEYEGGLNRARDLRLMDLDGNVVREFKGIGGCGMLCTSVDHLICVTGDSNGGARVVDPATGEVLLTCPRTDVKPRDAYPFLVTRYYTTFGFGRAAMSGAYKMVRIIDDEDCEVRTVGDGAGWRPAQPPPIVVPSRRGSPVAIHGVLYFLGKSSRCKDSLLCFDLESEQWRTMEGPHRFVDTEGWERAGLVRIAELNGDLCMVQMDNVSEPAGTSIWILTYREKGIWTKVYTIPMDPSTSVYVPLRVLGDDGKLLLHCSRCSFGRAGPLLLQVYDPQTETCVVVREMPGDLVGRIRLCSSHMDLPRSGVCNVAYN